MSKHFFYKLFPLFRTFLKKKLTANPLHMLGISMCFISGHGCFALITNKTEEICVTKKYKFVANGFTNFMIVDDKGRHFNVNNSVWYWKWDAIEDWTNVQAVKEKEKGEKEKEPYNKIFVGYYGYRIPVLGMFPNIIEFPAILDTKLDANDQIYKGRGDILKHVHIYHNRRL